MPLKPNALERLVLFRLNWGPAPVLDLFGAASFEAVALAFDLGLFEALETGSTTTADLAADLEVDADGLAPLLGYLEAQGYVVRDGDVVRNTAMASRWLTDAHGTNVGPWFTFWRELAFPFWEASLEQTVRRGAPDRTIYEWLDEQPGRWETAQRGFRAVATVALDEVVSKLDWPDGADSLLDLGGGHGLFAVECCRRRPGLSATVFDVPDALDVAAETVGRAGLEGRVTLAGGDYLEDDLDGGYDVGLLFNVIHAHDATVNRKLFGRAFDALVPGGRIAVLDQFEESTRLPVGRAGLAFVSLTYAATLGATIHPYDAVADWLREAGFADVGRRPIRRAGVGTALVQATKPE